MAKIRNYRNMSPEKATYLTGVLHRVKKKRVAKKLIRRLANGTFNGLLDWIGNKNKEKRGNMVFLPSNKELARRVYKK